MKDPRERSDYTWAEVDRVATAMVVIGICIGFVVGLIAGAAL